MPETDSEPVARGASALFGFAERYRRSDGRTGIRLRWRRIGIAFVALFIIGWIGKTAALYTVYKYHHEYNEVRLIDMFLFPINRTEVRAAFGDFQIERATQLLKDHDYSGANYLARVGLIRSPRNIEGRYIVADFAALRRPDQAIRVLEEGLPFAGRDPEYVSKLVSLLLHQREDYRVIELASELLPSEPAIDPFNQVLAMGAARALFFRGTYDKAESLILAYELHSVVEGLALLTEIAWNRGDRESALKRLEKAQQQFNPEESDRLHALISRYYRELGDYETARRHAIQRVVFRPFAVQPRIDLLYLSQQSGDHAKVRREAREILLQFAGNMDALWALGRFCAETGEVILAEEVYAAAVEKGFDLAKPALLLIESTIRSGDYAATIALCSDLAVQNPLWLNRNAAEFNTLRALGYFGIGNEDFGELYLARLLEVRNLRVENLLAASHHLIVMGYQEQARRLLESAYRMDPGNQAALAKLVALDIEQRNISQMAQNVLKLITLRRSSIELLQEAQTVLASDQFIFMEQRDALLTQLERAIAGNSPTPAMP